MNIQKLKEILDARSQPKFRFEQICKAIFQDGVSSFSEISTIGKDLRVVLEKEMRILSFDVEKVLVAKDGQSIKALLKIPANHSDPPAGGSESRADKTNNNNTGSLASLGMTESHLIETVLISPKPDVWSACISCQVGCAMGCRFCATGKMGFKRNLTAEEISDQVLFWRQYLRKTSPHPLLEKERGVLNNIVYMGMGEPFLNWENVSESIKNLTDEKLFGFGSRSLSVSTSGIIEGIEKMANEFPQVNLAISLHFSNDKKRDAFMPANKKDNMDALKKALKSYFAKTKRKVFIEYIMLEGFNDTIGDAREFAKYLQSIGSSHLLHVNLIRYNMTSQELRPSSKNKTHLFKDTLLKNHINATIRKSLGEEIKGACGQLAAD